MVEKLTQLWEDGWSCSAIALALGTTKGAVVSKRSRIGLPGRASGPQKKTLNALSGKDRKSKLKTHPWKLGPKFRPKLPKLRTTDAVVQVKVSQPQKPLETSTEPVQERLEELGATTLAPTPQNEPTPAPEAATAPSQGKLEPKGVPLLEVTPSQCRWPIGEWPRANAPFLYCGEPKDHPYAYCKDHCRKAFQSARRPPPSLVATTPSDFMSYRRG